MQVPDAIEPAVGYRVWRVDNNRIVSFNHHSVWTPYEPFIATCAAHPEPPDEKCSCGTYAAATFNRLYDMGYTGHGGLFSGRPDDILIAGTVNLWGNIIPGTHGWRAQFAYPKKFLIPYSNARIAKDIAAEYGVPYKLFNIVRKH
jgi:hypothetical protein